MSIAVSRIDLIFLQKVPLLAVKTVGDLHLSYPFVDFSSALDDHFSPKLWSLLTDLNPFSFLNRTALPALKPVSIVT